jgi:hypothetical protein
LIEEFVAMKDAPEKLLRRSEEEVAIGGTI